MNAVPAAIVACRAFPRPHAPASHAPREPDCIYVAASARDARFTRICVASIRYFYPDIKLRLLIGGQIEAGLETELSRYWDVQPSQFPAGEYGWGFVKLEPLFGPPGETFLVLDSDTVLTGPVLSHWADSDAPFVVDCAAQSDANPKELYFDWERLDEEGLPEARPQFVFNTGQWFGTAGVLSRSDFAPWLDWGMPPRLLRDDIFHCGEQGLFNLVLNRKLACGAVAVDRRPLMRWPGHSLDGLELGAIVARTAPPLVIHWAGMKKLRLRDMQGAELLQFFETQYYAQLPGGSLRRRVNTGFETAANWLRDARVKAAMRLAELARAQAGLCE